MDKDKNLINGINEILSNLNGKLNYKDKLVIKGLAKIFNAEPERWITTKTGARIPIFKGQSEGEAIEKFIDEKSGGGYSDKNESNRAQIARAKGLGTVKELAKELDITQREAELLSSTGEWHHTGKNYKQTSFYPIEAYTDLKEKGKISEKSIEKYELNDKEIKAITKSYEELLKRQSSKTPSEILEPYIKKYINDEYLQSTFKDVLSKKKTDSLSLSANLIRQYLDLYRNSKISLEDLEKQIAFFSIEEREKRKNNKK